MWEYQEQTAQQNQTIQRLLCQLENEQKVNLELQNKYNKQSMQLKILEEQLKQAQEELDVSRRITDDLGDKVNQLKLELNGQEGLGDK